MTMSVRGWARETRTPRQRITAALLRLRAQGIALRWGDYGVALRPLVTPLATGWQRSSLLGVNLIGAVLLAYQPERAPEDDNGAHEDPTIAAARALGVPLAYVEGLADGWDRAAHSADWLSHINRAAYLDGYEAGMEARFRETVVCGCGTRRFRSELTCPSCDESST
jgi:hypothetical protein